jgi:hypothetical protein
LLVLFGFSGWFSPYVGGVALLFLGRFFVGGSFFFRPF